MTPAERQARRRKRLARAAGSAATAGKRAKSRDKARASYIPLPRGVTHWVLVAAGEEGWAPVTKPLAACADDLTNDDVLALLDQLRAIAAERGLI